MNIDPFEFQKSINDIKRRIDIMEIKRQLLLKERKELMDKLNQNKTIQELETEISKALNQIVDMLKFLD